MNPKAWLKSLNTNFFAMASRPGTSDHPLRRASADFRPSAVNFCAMMNLTAPNAQASQRVRANPTFYRSNPTIRGIHVLVIKYRQGGGDCRPRTSYFPLVSRVDFRGELRIGRRVHCLGQPR